MTYFPLVLVFCYSAVIKSSVIIRNVITRGHNLAFALSINNNNDRIPDDVSHILVGVCHGRCVRVMTGGLEMRVLEVANARSVAGCGCESFSGVHCTGFVNGDCPWDLSLRQRTGNEEI